MEISNWIEKWADHTPDQVAIRYRGDDISYSGFAARVSNCARALKQTLGIGRGDRVAFLDNNHPNFFYLLFACARLGALLVPLNWRLAAAEHLYVLRNAGASILIADPMFRDTFRTVQNGAPQCRCIVSGPSDMDDCWSLSDLMNCSDGDDSNPSVSLDSPLLIVYTAGTTGRPKGAILSQKALFWNAINSQVMHGMSCTDHVLTVLPLFHVGGLNIQTTPAFHCGATVTLHRTFDPGRVLREIQDSRPTLCVLVPAQLLALIEQPAWPSVDLSCLRALTTGSTIVPQGLIKAWRDRQVPVLQVYGSTETCPIATYQTVATLGDNYASVGKPAMHCEIRIVDAHGDDAEHEVRGEILVRGANVMDGYWGDIDATRAAFKDDWFRTGDIGYRDAGGFYYIVDRQSDVIHSGGENIYPAELECILHEHPDIKEAAVVERADHKWGEVPVVVLSLVPGSLLSKEAVLALFQDRIGKYKHPKDVIFVDALPRNAMGKVQKHTIRETFVNSHSQ